MTTEIANLIDYEDRPRWLAARNSGVGASESSALFNASPWDTVVSLWAKKTGKIAEPEMSGEWLTWGSLLEAPIAKAYAERTGRQIWQGSPFAVAVHPDVPIMRATPDYLVISAPGRDSRGVLQVKNTNAFKAHDWDDGVPQHIEIQVQHELAVTGFKWGSVAVLVGGCELRHFDIERNDDFIGELVKQVEWFWGYVENDVQPSVDGSARTLDTLKKLHPSDDGSEIALPDEAIQWWEELCEVRALESQIRKNKPEIEIRLLNAIGKATFGKLPDGRRISCKTIARAAYAVEANTYRTMKLDKEDKPKGRRR